MLLLGLDYGDGRRAPVPAAPTMILLTVDPLTREAGILNIRATCGSASRRGPVLKINAAYFLGQAYNLPDGGPGWRSIVEQFLGVPINTRPDRLPPSEIHQCHQPDQLDIKRNQGGSSLEGNTVLRSRQKRKLRGLSPWHARQRYTEGGDFDRANRQQEVMMAIPDRVTEPDRFPTTHQGACAVRSAVQGHPHQYEPPAGDQAGLGYLPAAA
jgi:hypothetical protein